MGQIIAYGLAFLLLTIYFYFKYKEIPTEKKHLILCYLFTFFLLFMLIEIVGFPSFKEFYQLKQQTGSWYHGSRNFLLFNDGLAISDYLNVVLFIPIGFILPVLWGKYRQLLPTVLYGLGLSMVIEFSQLFTFYRVTDINDLVMNTIGTVLGWLIFKLVFRYRKLGDQLFTEDKYEQFLLPSIAIFSTLFI